MHLPRSQLHLLITAQYAHKRGMDRIYLDHAAATPLDPEVLAEMLPYFGPEYGNPSSIHASGRRAARAITSARSRVAKILGAQDDEIIFTGSGTESDTLALLGAARANASRGRHIVISAIEHKAVMESARALEREGFEVTVAPVDKHGVVTTDAVVRLVRDDSVLISIMLVNNELGTVLPVAPIAAALRERRAKTGLPLLHSDACQAAGFLQLDVRALGVDLLTLNGSKVYGPRGIGVLYVKRGTRLTPLILGGAQEQGLRAGTESVPLIAGMAAALIKAETVRTAEATRLETLRSYFVSGLVSRIPGVIINGHPLAHAPHIVHITVPGIEGESMLLALDAAGIEAATGSACSATDLKPSHVLVAMGQSDSLLHGSIRFSLGRSTTKDQLDRVLSHFPPIVRKLRHASALTTHLYVKNQHVR